MFLRPIPDGNEDLLFSLKRPEENFGIAKFSLRDIHFDIPAEIPIKLKDMKEYITHSHLSINKLRNIGYAMSEALPKATWLADEFLHQGGFRNPMGLHWRPDWENENCDEGKWIIHPGGTRQWIAYCFADHDEPMEFAAFNTMGQELEFDHVFQSHEEACKYFKLNYNSKLFLANVCEYGTLIPHALTDTQILEKCTGKYHKICQKRLKTYNIVFENNGVNKLLDFPYDPNKKNILINIKSFGDSPAIPVYKSIILSMLYDQYQDENIEIIATDKCEKVKTNVSLGIYKNEIHFVTESSMHNISSWSKIEPLYDWNLVSESIVYNIDEPNMSTSIIPLENIKNSEI